MAVSQSDIDRLNTAIASGARSVTIGGQTVTYNTTASLISARDDLQRQLDVALAQVDGKRPPKRKQLYYAGRGY